jgi:hypothetical protein
VLRETKRRESGRKGIRPDSHSEIFLRYITYITTRLAEQLDLFCPLFLLSTDLKIRSDLIQNVQSRLIDEIFTQFRVFSSFLFVLIGECSTRDRVPRTSRSRYTGAGSSSVCSGEDRSGERCRSSVRRRRSSLFLFKQIRRKRGVSARLANMKR